MATPSVILAHRQPTFRFLRSHDVEPDCQVCLYWDGHRAPNGDGVANDDGQIDFATPIAGPLSVWRRGHLQMFGGGWDCGGALDAHADADPAMGWDAGPWDQGHWDAKRSWWEWRIPFLLRDGVYQLAAKVRDAIGNEQAEPDEILAIQIRALPRPAFDLQVDFDPMTGRISARWRPSPEFEAAA